MELLILLTTSTFFILWNILAVIGLVFVIVRLVKFMSNPGKSKNETKARILRQVKKRSDKERLHPGIVFLNIGLIFIWISALFLGLSERFIASPSNTKWFIPVLFLFHFGLIFLLSLNKKTTSSQKLVMNLTFVSIVYFGLTFWFRNALINTPLTRGDYFLLLSLLITAISYTYYKVTSSSIYFTLFSLFPVLAVIFAGDAFFVNPVYRYPFIVLGSVVLFFLLRHFLKSDKNYGRIFLPLYRVIILALGIGHIGFIFISQFSIDTTKEIITNSIVLMLPLLYSILVKFLDKRGITLIVEGLLFPLRIIAISTIILIAASSYSAWIISITLFIGAALLTFAKAYKDPSFRRFIFSVLFSGMILSYILMFTRPFYIENFDPFMIGVTLLVTQTFFAIKSVSCGLIKTRAIEPLIQIGAISALLYSFDLNFSTEVFNRETLSIVITIPATIYIVEMLLSKNLQRSKYVAFNALLLLTTSIILSTGAPVINLLTSTYTFINILLISVLFRTSLFGFPLTAVLLIIVTALCKILYIEGIMLLIANTSALFIAGNIWRITSIIKDKTRAVHELANDVRRTSMSIGILFLLYSFLTIHYTDHLILILYVLLSLLFISSPTKESRLRYVAGIGLVLTLWHLLNISDTPKYANAQLYVFPVVILTLATSIKAADYSKFISNVGLIVAISLPLNVALLQSLFDPHPYNLVQGGLLIITTLTLMIFGTIKGSKLLKYLSLVYLIIEFIIMWARYSEVIPWWIYPSVLGVIFVFLSIKITLGISDTYPER